jgi:hypothetical protein
MKIFNPTQGSSTFIFSKAKKPTHKNKRALTANASKFAE